MNYRGTVELQPQQQVVNYIEKLNRDAINHFLQSRFNRSAFSCSWKQKVLISGNVELHLNHTLDISHFCWFCSLRWWCSVFRKSVSQYISKAFVKIVQFVMFAQHILDISAKNTEVRKMINRKILFLNILFECQSMKLYNEHRKWIQSVREITCEKLKWKICDWRTT